MKKLNSIREKLQSVTKARLEKKLLKKEGRISLLKEVDERLSEVVLPDVTIKIDSKNEFVQTKLASVQKKLLKYEDQIAKTASATEKNLQLLDKKIQKENKKYESKLKKAPNKKEQLEAKHLHKLDVFNAKIEKANNSKQKKTMKLLAQSHTTYEKEVYKVKVEIAHLNHQNKVINDNLWWNNLPNEEKKEKRTDLSFYIPDVLGYWLTLLSVIGEIVYLILLLSEMQRTFWVGICILVNIAFLLLLFTIAIKVKNYKIKFSYVSIAFGLYFILRIAYIIHGLMGVDLSAYSTVKLAFIYGANAYMILASIFVGVHSLIKIKHQMRYLSENKITKFQLSK